MADRTRFLPACDIRHPRRLRRVHDVALSYGDALQYSVFICDLTSVERIALRRALKDEMDERADSVALFDLGPPRDRGVECIEFLGQRRELREDGGATVW